MKLIEIATLIIFVAAIHLAGCDSESWTWFLWSKVAAVCLLGVSALIFIKTEA